MGKRFEGALEHGLEHAPEKVFRKNLGKLLKKLFTNQTDVQTKNFKKFLKGKQIFNNLILAKKIIKLAESIAK